jgi:pimeloyl-ACP methyl ester carboxylesterase
LVLAFDYRGWGASDSRVVLVDRAPMDAGNHRFKAEVQAVREVVDPLDMSADILNAIHWVVGDPQCDTHRIGLWGSSFSGGLVVYAAEHDPRVKALHSQVPALDGRWVVSTAENRALTYEESTRRARGEIGYPAPREKVIGNLIGAPIRSRFVAYYPVEEVDKAPQCAMQFLIAEKEELFDNKGRYHSRNYALRYLLRSPRASSPPGAGLVRQESESALALGAQCRARPTLQRPYPATEPPCVSMRVARRWSRPHANA